MKIKKTDAKTKELTDVVTSFTNLGKAGILSQTHLDKLMKALTAPPEQVSPAKLKGYFASMIDTLESTMAPPLLDTTNGQEPAEAPSEEGEWLADLKKYVQDAKAEIKEQMELAEVADENPTYQDPAQEIADLAGELEKARLASLHQLGVIEVLLHRIEEDYETIQDLTKSKAITLNQQINAHLDGEHGNENASIQALLEEIDSKTSQIEELKQTLVSEKFKEKKSSHVLPTKNGATVYTTLPEGVDFPPLLVVHHCDGTSLPYSEYNPSAKATKDVEVIEKRLRQARRTLMQITTLATVAVGMAPSKESSPDEKAFNGHAQGALPAVAKLIAEFSRAQAHAIAFAKVLDSYAMGNQGPMPAVEVLKAFGLMEIPTYDQEPEEEGHP